MSKRGQFKFDKNIQKENKILNERNISEKNEINKSLRPEVNKSESFKSFHIDFLKKIRAGENKFLIHLFKDDSNIILTGYADSVRYNPSYFDNIIIPSFSLSCLAHEIAHLVEIEQNRIFKINYGFDLITEYPHNLSKKYAALEREQRVKVIEKIILSENPRTYRNNNFHWRFCGGKFNTHEEVTDWLDGVINYTIANWWQDKIEFEWFNRISLLKEHNTLNSVK